MGSPIRPLYPRIGIGLGSSLRGAFKKLAKVEVKT